MKMTGKFAKIALLSAAFLLMSFSVGYAQSAEVSFKVFNKSDTTIKKLLVSQDGKKYGFFDIGKGIAAGKSVTLVWDPSSYDDNCVQFIKAVFADNSESAPVEFDFCEDDLELEFN